MNKLKNKYLLTLLVFLIWVAFFDGNNLIRQFKLYNELKETRYKEKNLQLQITETKNALKQLYNNTELEKFAREQYYFKKHNEDIFIIVEE